MSPCSVETMPWCRFQHIRTFAAFGSLQSANQAFGQILKPSLHAWHTVISAHASSGHSRIALELFYYLYYQGDLPNRFVFACIVKVCSKAGALETGKLLHHAIVSVSLEPDVVVGCALLDMYLRCACVHDAVCIFNRQTNRNVVTWGAMIGGYTQLGLGFAALNLFVNMQQEGLNPDRVIYICLLKACGQLQNILQALVVHVMICECMFDLETSIINSLVDTYSKCGMLDDALYVFYNQRRKDIVSWGALIKGYTQHGHGDAAFQLFQEMHSKGVQPNEIIMLCVLKACATTLCLTQCYHMHDMIVKNNFHLDRAIGNTLVSVYAKCGSLEDAAKVFDALKNRDVASWGAMMTGYAQNGLCLRALDFLTEMEESGIKPDKFAFSCGLNACGGIGAILEGRLLHNCILRNGFDGDIVVANALLDMYVKSGSLKEARRVFDRLLNRDSISWAAMIGGYADHGMCFDAFRLFVQMNHKGVEPNKVSFLSILKASNQVESIVYGKLVHDLLIRCGFESDISVGNTLVDMYCKCGWLEEAYKVFNCLNDRTVVSWSAIIAGYAQHEHDFIAIQLFERMQKEGVEPNKSIFLSSLKACGSIGAVSQGCMMHDLVLRSGFATDVEIDNTLLDMYAKCGLVEEAHKLFKGLQPRSESTWAAMIAAYASRGDTRMVQQFLDDMHHQGSGPNANIFMSVLMACSHAGKLQAGQSVFRSMYEVYDIAPSNEHFTCMIDLFGRAGCLLEAKQFLQCMPVSSDISGWMSLLTACQMYSNVELAKNCLEELVKLDPEYTAGYLLMSKVFVDANKWDDANKLDRAMGSFGASKKGKAGSKLDDPAQEFYVEDQMLSKSGNLYTKPKYCKIFMENEGQEAHMDGVLEHFHVCPQKTVLCEKFDTGALIANKDSLCESPHTNVINEIQKQFFNETIYSRNSISPCFL